MRGAYQPTNLGTGKVRNDRGGLVMSSYKDCPPGHPDSTEQLCKVSGIGLALTGIMGSGTSTFNNRLRVT